MRRGGQTDGREEGGRKEGGREEIKEVRYGERGGWRVAWTLLVPKVLVLAVSLLFFSLSSLLFSVRSLRTVLVGSERVRCLHVDEGGGRSSSTEDEGGVGAFPFCLAPPPLPLTSSSSSSSSAPRSPLGTAPVPPLDAAPLCEGEILKHALRESLEKRGNGVRCV